MAEIGTWLASTKVDTTAWEAGLASDLVPGEVVVAFAHIFRFKPVMEAMAITNRRVIGFATQSRPGKKVKIEARAEDIRSIEFVEKMVTTKLYVHTGVEPVYLGEVMPQETDFIGHHIDLLCRAIAIAQAPPAPPRPPRVSLQKPNQPPVDVATPTLLSDEIARLADMHQKGWLDADEFRAAKRAVIARMG